MGVILFIMIGIKLNMSIWYWICLGIIYSARIIRALLKAI
jgi:hypothetical protein